MLGDLGYARDLFEDETIAHLIDHYQRLLEGCVANPDRRISRLPLLSEAERRHLLAEVHASVPAEVEQDGLVQAIESQVARSADPLALVCGEQQLTFARLNREANQLAWQLVACGVTAETLVALLDERRNAFIVAILAIWKTGGVYLPLDPLPPVSRLARSLRESGCRLLLTSADTWMNEPVLQELVATGSPPLVDSRNLPAHPGSTDTKLRRIMKDEAGSSYSCADEESHGRWQLGMRTCRRAAALPTWHISFLPLALPGHLKE